MAGKPGKTLVMKFGGTSVGSIEAIENVQEIVASARLDWPRQVVVVSAFSGITNGLLNSAQSAARGIWNRSMKRFGRCMSGMRV